MERSLLRLFIETVRLLLFDWEGMKDKGGVKYSGERWGPGHKHMQEWACENIVKCWNTETDSPWGSVAGAPLPYLSLFFRSKNIFRETSETVQQAMVSVSKPNNLSAAPKPMWWTERTPLASFPCAHIHTHPCTPNKLKLWSSRKRS